MGARWEVWPDRKSGSSSSCCSIIFEISRLAAFAYRPARFHWHLFLGAQIEKNFSHSISRWVKFTSFGRILLNNFFNCQIAHRQIATKKFNLYVYRLCEFLKLHKAFYFVLILKRMVFAMKKSLQRILKLLSKTPKQRRKFALSAQSCLNIFVAKLFVQLKRNAYKNDYKNDGIMTTSYCQKLCE